MRVAKVNKIPKYVTGVRVHVQSSTIENEVAIIPMLTTNFKFRILSRIMRKTIPNSPYRSMKQQNQNRSLTSVVVKGKEIKKGTERQSERNGESELGYSSLLFVQWCVPSTACTIWTVNVCVPGE